VGKGGATRIVNARANHDAKIGGLKTASTAAPANTGLTANSAATANKGAAGRGRKVIRVSARNAGRRVTRGVLARMIMASSLIANAVTRNMSAAKRMIANTGAGLSAANAIRAMNTASVVGAARKSAAWKIIGEGRAATATRSAKMRIASNTKGVVGKENASLMTIAIIASHAMTGANARIIASRNFAAKIGGAVSVNTAGRSRAAARKIGATNRARSGDIVKTMISGRPRRVANRRQDHNHKDGPCSRVVQRRALHPSAVRGIVRSLAAQSHAASASATSDKRIRAKKEAAR
jgi:hypothetical protein